MDTITYKRKAAINPSILRVIIFLLIWLLIMVLFETLGLFFMDDMFPNMDQRSPVFFTIARSFETLLTFGLIFIFRKYVDHRPFLANWFSWKSRQFDLLIGFVIGSVLISLGSFILGQSGVITFFPGQINLDIGLQYLLMFLVGAILEEVVFRGYVLDNLLEDVNPILAVIISSGLFMVIHLNNPNLDALPIVNLFLAGVLMSIPFVFSRNLWLPLGLHWAWNFFQGPVFGFEVSGLVIKNSVLSQETKSGLGLWAGGEFGFEGSLLATFLMTGAIIIFYFYFNRKKLANENL